MTSAHAHGAASSLQLVLLLPFAVAAIAYVAATVSEGRRGSPWPSHRTALWMLGLVVAAATLASPLAHTGFTGHMAAHLLVGMLAPLLLVTAAPITLALRTLHTVPARRLSRLLKSTPARILIHPITAAVLNVGSLWVLYRTPLFEAVQVSPLLHAAVMVHFLLAGYLFTASIVSRDPSPHRASFPMRSAVLLLALAAHGALAKSLYAYPPPGVAAADAHAGAQLMFYGGDAVDLVIIVLLCLRWYRATGRRLAPVASTPVRSTP